MNDMSAAIVPKTDQLNADSILTGPITVTISDVSIRPGTEQPVSIHYEGDEGRPWKPCKSMCRVLVSAWGPDAKAYVGRSVTLYRDPAVKWGGMEVGGIRISHMSHMESALTMALTATRGSKKLHTVRPLVAPVKPASATDEWAQWEKDLAECATLEALTVGFDHAWKAAKGNADARNRLKAAYDKRKTQLTNTGEQT